MNLQWIAPNRRNPATLLLLFGLVLAGCQLFRPAGGIPDPDTWPTEGWRTAAPETQGFDSAKLAEGLRAIRANGTRVHSVILIRDGYVFLHANFYPYDGTTVHDMASVTKSVMTTLIGIAVDQGKLSLDDPMVSFFPDRTIANLDDRKGRITVRDLATMTSGLACDPEDDAANVAAMMAGDDWVQYSLDRPVSHEPGTQFVYCSPSIHLLSAILQKATGMTALEFAQQNLFGPLGIGGAWESDPQGYSRGWGDILLFPDDAAKLGLLMLHGGEWDGRQIISQDWVTEATKRYVGTDRGDDYGYAWWVSPSNETVPFFSADGRGGQFVRVFPGLNAILATTGGGFDDMADVGDYLGAALVDPENPLPPNPAGETELASAIAEVGAAPAAEAVLPISDMAETVSGKVYRLEPNPLGMLWVRLDFDDPAEAVMQFEISGEPGPRSIPVGLDGTLHIAPVRQGALGGARGAWTEPGTFVVDYDEIGRIDTWRFEMVFQGQDLLLLVFGPASVKIEGSAN